MADPADNIQLRRLKILLLVSSLVSILFLLLAAFEENRRGEWRQHQQDYRSALIQRADSEQTRRAAEEMDIGFRQLFLPDLKRIDRCVTCHVGADDPKQGGPDTPQPLRAHSGDHLAHHPVDRFGCTICHDGQGRAIEKDAAHGEVHHWPSPILKGESVYTSCGRCHYENDLFGAEYDLYARSGPLPPLDQAELDVSIPGSEAPEDRAIGRGKQLVMGSGCLGCHKFRDRGGVLGPDITHVGDKTVHDFDFKNVEGDRSIAQWMFEHFKKPGQVVPGTLMPDMNLGDDQARDLSQYMLSLHSKGMPAAFTPVPPRRGGDPVGGERLFSMFCNSCHGRQGQGSTVLDPELRMLAEPPRQLITPAINNPDTLAVASDDYFRRIIRTGRRGTNMIGWTADAGGLTDNEIERLVHFIRQWQHPGPALDSVSASKGNARWGRALYRARCSACHGSSGEGGIGVALKSPSFLAVASDMFIARSIVHGRPNTAMPAWKHLDADEVNDLIAFIRTWEAEPPDRDQVLSSLASNTAPSGRALRIGKSIYRANCSACHGSAGEGGIGPSLNHDAFLSVVDDGYLYDAVVKGRPGTAMPAWKHLSGEDLVDLIHFMRSWNDRRRIELEPFIASGDREYGKIIYQGACAACHGSEGEGTIGSQLNNPVFLESATDSMLRHWVRFGKSGTQMRAFAKGQQEMVELTESQIEDVVTYVRSLEMERPLVTSRPGIGIIAHGAEIYASACASCHGANGEGATGSALSNIDFLRSASDGYLQATIALGRDGTEMRAMGKGGQGNVELSSEDINNVVAFIRNWEREPPIRGIPARYVIGADLELGRELFAGHCAGCHGTNGHEGWAPALNNEDFLAAATDGFLQATIAVGRSHTPMRPYGRGADGVAELTGDQINNIVGFIRMWAPQGHRPEPQTETSFPVAEPKTDTEPGSMSSARMKTMTEPMKSSTAH